MPFNFSAWNVSCKLVNNLQTCAAAILPTDTEKLQQWNAKISKFWTQFKRILLALHHPHEIQLRWIESWGGGGWYAPREKQRQRTKTFLRWRIKMAMRGNGTKYKFHVKNSKYVCSRWECQFVRCEQRDFSLVVLFPFGFKKTNKKSNSRLLWKIRYEIASNVIRNDCRVSASTASPAAPTWLNRTTQKWFWHSFSRYILYVCIVCACALTTHDVLFSLLFFLLWLWPLPMLLPLLLLFLIDVHLADDQIYLDDG